MLRFELGLQKLDLMKYKNSTKGFILKKNFYKDTSVFLEIFSQDFWKRSFFIKNFKKSKNINPAFLWLWSEISFYFSEKWNVPTISEISYLDWFENLDQENLQYLSYFLWFISKFFWEEEKNFEIYNFLKKFFYTLKNFPEKISVLKIFFEIKILSQLWFLWDLDKYWDSQEKISLSWKNFFDKQEVCFCSEKILDNFFLKDSTVKFLFFLQKNNIENVLNISVEEDEEKKLFSIFNTFLIDHWFNKLVKIFWQVEKKFSF